MKIILNKKIIFLLISVFFLSFLFTKVAFAIWDGLPYNPGETNNPECLPSQTDCDVLPAVTTETDPVFIATEAFTITGTDTTNWDTAFGWGNHSTAGYVTGTPWTSLGYITDGNTNWDNSYGFINSYTETDPVFTAWDKDYADLTNTPSIPSTLASLSDDATHRLVNDTEKNTWNGKQDLLVSGTNIKTINGSTLLGSTDILLQTPLTAGVNYEVPLTFSSGLTRAVNTITNNLITGLAGGQTIIGGTGASESLTLSSTSHATKGNILFGTSAYDEVNNRLGIGMISPTYKLDVYGTGATDGINTNIGLNLTQVATAVNTATYTVAPDGSVDVGDHYYNIVYYTALGETGVSNRIKVTTTTGNQTVNITNIPISSDPSVIGRKIFRSKIGEGSSYGWLVGTIADNTTTSFSDTVTDASRTDNSGFIFKANTTNKFITINGATSMVLDANQTIFGRGAGLNLTSGNQNVFIGPSAGSAITTGTANTIIGNNSGGSGTSSQNVLIGPSNGLVGGGNYNVGIGSFLFQGNGTKTHNIGIGYGAGSDLTGATSNIILGGYSFTYVTTGDFNASLGAYAGYGKTVNSTGNISLGYQSLYGSGESSYNVAVGHQSGYSNTTGGNNVFIGRGSGSANTTTANNIFVGHYSGRYETGANTLIIDSLDRTTEALGRTAALIYGTTDATSANQILSLGGGGKVGIGTTTPATILQVISSTTTDALYGRADNANAIAVTGYSTYGRAGFFRGGGALPVFVTREITGLTGNLFQWQNNAGTGLGGIDTAGKMGIGNTTPSYLLHVGSASVTDATVLLRLQDADSTCDFTANTGTPSCGSDETLKKNINDQSDNLSKIIALRPVTYNWLTDEDGVEAKHGFIAQEVATVMPELVTDGTWIDGTTRKFLQTAGMTPYIVGAIKEMNLKLEGLNNFNVDEEGNLIVNSWRDSLLAWFANAENRITRIFTGEVCITEVGQEPVCLNRVELQSLKALLNQQEAVLVQTPEEIEAQRLADLEKERLAKEAETKADADAKKLLDEQALLDKAEADRIAQEKAEAEAKAALELEAQKKAEAEKANQDQVTNQDGTPQ